MELIVENGQFKLDGKKFNVYSGAMHYFRILPEYWEDRLLKLKAAGFNTVETYVAWNMHEPKEGEFVFTGIADVRRFIETAKKAGLYAIVRPGPYICAEWDFGGLPSWLLKDKNLRVRCNDENYLTRVENFYKRLFGQISDLQITKGGNIIAVQVENEYGSFGSDKTYLDKLKNIIRKQGIDVLNFTSDGGTDFMLSGGTLPYVFKTVNFGSNPAVNFAALSRAQKNAPEMCTEFWCGWFDHYREKHHTRGYKSILKVMNEFFDRGASFNFYMFHGGTNFGFTAGANYRNRIQPTVTSYDYCSPLNEYGDYTESYYKIRELMCERQGINPPTLPPRPKTQYIGKVALTQKTGLFENLENIGNRHKSPMPEPFEIYGETQGMIFYKTKLSGDYGTGSLTLENLNDRAYVYIDGELKKVFDNTKKQSLTDKMLGKNTFIVNGLKKGTEISVLVDAFGHVNYGRRLCDRKGIDGLSFNNQYLMEFDVVTLPLDNLEKLDYMKGAEKYPMFFKGEFRTQSDAECFVRLDNFTKGAVYVNGFNLGRFWKAGPQKTLYLPGVLLRTDGVNTIEILELEKCLLPEIEITDRHDLG